MNTVSIAQNKEKRNSCDLIIQQVFNDDQQIRLQIGEAEKSEKMSIDSLMPLYLKMVEQDIINQNKVLPILDKYLNKEIVLNDSSLNALFYIIQHADFSIQEKYKNFINDIFYNDIISNVQYAQFLDRLAVRHNRAQLYAHQTYMNAYTQDRFLYPISSKYVEESIKIGLVPDKRYLNSIFVDEYSPIYIDSSKYVVFGHTLNVQNNMPLENTTIKTSNAETTTNKKGFFRFIFERKNLPSELIFEFKNQVVVKKISSNNNIFDWEIIDVYLDGGL